MPKSSNISGHFCISLYTLSTQFHPCHLQTISTTQYKTLLSLIFTQALQCFFCFFFTATNSSLSQADPTLLNKLGGTRISIWECSCGENCPAITWVTRLDANNTNSRQQLEPGKIVKYSPSSSSPSCYYG